MLGWLRSIIGAPDPAGTLPGRDESLRGVRDELADLSRDMKSLRLEWEETYESVNRALRKMAKREKRAAADSECEDCPPSNGGAPQGVAGRPPSLAEVRSRLGRSW